jgi:hypothetical protein
MKTVELALDRILNDINALADYNRKRAAAFHVLVRRRPFRRFLWRVKHLVSGKPYPRGK